MDTFYNPLDKNVNIFKDLRIPKSQKKDVILKTLNEDKRQFYQLRDYLHHNYYYFVIKLFTDPGDEDLFRSITLEVCKDIKDDPIVYDKYENKIDIFGNTFLSKEIINESPYNVLAQSGKFEFIDIMLDCLKEYGLNDRMDVSSTDNYNKTIIDYAIEKNKLSDIRSLAEKFSTDFNFDFAKKSQTGKTMEEVIKDRYAPIVKALKNKDFEAFEESFEKMLEGEEEPLPFDDRVDVLGFSFVHNLCLMEDYLYIDLILHHWEANSKKVKEILFIEDLNEELNRYHKVAGYTPLTGIIANGTKDMVDYVFTKVFLDRIIKFDVSPIDGRGRNILHMLARNHHLDHEFKLSILNKNIAILTEGLLHNSTPDQVTQMYNVIDDDGFTPFSTYLTQLSPILQKEATVKLTVEFLIEKTDFEKTVFQVTDGPLIHPFIPIIQMGLNEVYEKLVELKPELKATLFFCDYVSGRTTLEYAFTAKNEFFIEPIIEALSEIESFIVHNNTRTLFGICESIFMTLKEDGCIPSDSDSNAKGKNSDNKIFTLYQKLVEMVYTNSRSKSGSKAQHILEKFKLKHAPKPVDVYQGNLTSKKVPKKIREKVAKAVEESKRISVSIQEKSRKVTDYNSLYLLAYEHNNFVTFPLIHDMGSDMPMGLDDIKKSLLKKHKVIFTCIMKRLLDNIDSLKLAGYAHSNRLADLNENVQYDYEEETDPEKAKEVSKEAKEHETPREGTLLSVIADLDFKYAKALAAMNKKNKFLDKLHEFSMDHPNFSTKVCALNTTFSCFGILKDENIKRGCLADFVYDMSEVEAKSFVETFKNYISMMATNKAKIPFDKTVKHWSAEPQGRIIQKALLCNCLQDLVEYQELIKDSLNAYYEEAIKSYIEYKKNPKEEEEQIEEGGCPRGAMSYYDEEDNENCDMGETVYPPEKNLASVIRLLKFDYNSAIDFSEDPRRITEIIFNFFKLNFSFFINVQNIPRRTSDGSNKQLEEMNKKGRHLVKLMKMVKNARAKHGGFTLGSARFDYHTLLTFIKHPEFNYITQELLHKDLPVFKSYERNLGINNSLFNACIHYDNTELAVKILKKCDIDNTLYGLPFEQDTVTKIIQSDAAMPILEFLGDHKDKLKGYFCKSNEDYESMHARFLERYVRKKFNVHEEAENKKEPEGEDYEEDYYDDDYDKDFTKRDTLFYAYYQYDNFVTDCKNRFSEVDLMFYTSGYLPDELVKKLSVDQIKTLNSKGFNIGKYVNITEESYRANDKIIDETETFYNSEDKTFLTKTNMKNAIMKDIEAMKFPNDRYVTKIALKDALLRYKIEGSTDDSLVQYCATTFIEEKEKNSLFLPEVIWICSKYLPVSHNILKKLLNDEKAYENYVLFEYRIPDIECNKNFNPYSTYYKYETRVLMWGDMACLILPAKKILSKVLGKIKDIYTSENLEISPVLMQQHIAKCYYKLYKYTIESSNPDALGNKASIDIKNTLAQIFDSASNGSPELFSEYKFDIYDPKFKFRMPMVFAKVVKKASQTHLDSLPKATPTNENDNNGEGEENGDGEGE